MPEKQKWDAREYAVNARFVADLGLPVVELLAPKPGEKILDLGCGDGALTLKLQQMGVVVTGVDPSAEMVSAAQALGVQAVLRAGEDLDFDHEFNAVFTNAALHWVNDIDKVLAGVARVLKSGGRFVGEFGGHGNVAAIATALIAVLNRHKISWKFPWYFPSQAEFTAKLQAHGFKINSIAIIPRPTLLPTGMRKWLEVFANPFTHSLAPESKSQVLDEVVELLNTSLCDQSGKWTADYVRLRFAASH